jgi:hypothetical protein
MITLAPRMHGRHKTVLVIVDCGLAAVGRAPE